MNIETLGSLAEYLVKQHRGSLEAVFAGTQEQSVSAPLISAFARPAPVAVRATKLTGNQNKDGIAIVGLGGRYPGAKDLTAFWENLKAGTDCIEEIPADRWDWRKYYTDDKNEPKKSYSKWGSFLRDVDNFDPLFFNIAPREAELMDPQERLLLEVMWSTLEDAGFNPLHFHHLHSGKAGVFVGLMWNEYSMLCSEQLGEGIVFGNPTNSSIANRVSYYFNLSGPSLVIDTACSSSLVAIHMACESLREASAIML